MTLHTEPLAATLFFSFQQQAAMTPHKTKAKILTISSYVLGYTIGSLEWVAARIYMLVATQNSYFKACFYKKHVDTLLPVINNFRKTVGLRLSPFSSSYLLKRQELFIRSIVNGFPPNTPYPNTLGLREHIRIFYQQNLATKIMPDLRRAFQNLTPQSAAYLNQFSQFFYITTLCTGNSINAGQNILTQFFYGILEANSSYHNHVVNLIKTTVHNLLTKLPISPTLRQQILDFNAEAVIPIACFAQYLELRLAQIYCPNLALYPKINLAKTHLNNLTLPQHAQLVNHLLQNTRPLPPLQQSYDLILELSEYIHKYNSTHITYTPQGEPELTYHNPFSQGWQSSVE